MVEQNVSFNFKARYFKIGEIDAHTKQVWFVLHGYGQLAKYFLQKFNILLEQNVCVVAPEGLSKFYLEDAVTRSQTGSTRVGATWMTRENRLTEIDNYLQYLNKVYEIEMQGHKHIPVTIVGFSQGAATASRWVLSGTPFSKLILWAGIFPDDMDFEKGKEILKGKDVRMVYGTNDIFLTEQRITEMKLLAAKTGVLSEPQTFDGGHQIDERTLLKLI